MCSIEEAFEMFSDVPCASAVERQARETARSDRKRKRRRALLPPEPFAIDPDRPANRPMPPAELLSGYTPEYTDTPPSPMLNALSSGNQYPHPSSDVDSESVYNLEPDWTKPFNSTSAPDWIKERMPKRDADSPLTPSPWMDGAPSLWQSVPDSLQTQFNYGGLKTEAEKRVDDLQQRLDSMFAKLDDMEAGRIANNHMEILMFVLGGLFLLLIIDLLVKQGMQASAILAAAGGAMVSGGRRGLAWV